MLSYLDSIIFPDRCEVIEIANSQRYVYPIFKNGRSTVTKVADQQHWRIFLNQQIYKLNSIDIVLRDPTTRLISGINTFIQQTVRDNPNLDYDTVLWFAKNYFALNRHYSLQFSWLVNLARYINPNTKLNLFDMSYLTDTFNKDIKPIGVNDVTDKFKHELGEVPNSEMYLRIDQTLISAIGQSLTFAQLLMHIKQQDTTAYDCVIGRSQRILNPIYALSKA